MAKADGEGGFIGGNDLPLGLYLHLPFCLSKCPYCDFASFPLEEAGGLPAARRYLDALAVEMDLRAASDEFHGAPVATIYLGGGTPTILPSDWLADLLARIRLRFPVSSDAEITIEANPGTVDEEKIAALLASGVNRLSLGVQSFSDEVLRTLGRAHTAADAQAAISAARGVARPAAVARSAEPTAMAAASGGLASGPPSRPSGLGTGCANLNLDLIYGVPNQSLDQWEDTLQRSLTAAPDHISAYALTLEPHTPLAADISAGRLPAPDDDLTADMYALAADALPAAGYQHYEISNFALPHKECQHNSGYWANAEYLGLGASAHSYRAGIRWNNSPAPEVYTQWLERGRLPVARAETLSPRQRVGEMLMLGLRRAEGVCEDDLKARCGLTAHDVFAADLAQLRQEGLLVVTERHLTIPREKWIISNEIVLHFIR